jgi:predicted permease
MSLLRNLTRGLRSLFRKEQVDRELDEELRAYQEMAAEEKMKGGMSRKEALRAVRLERGSVEASKEMLRSGGWEFFLETCWQDLRFAGRTVRKSPGFTAVAVLTLALGIGANTAIFSLLNALLLRDLPVQNPSRLVLLGTAHSYGSTGEFAFTNLYSYSFYQDFRQKNQVFSDVCSLLSLQFGGMHGAIDGSGNLEPMNVQLVSGTYFSTLGVRPNVGRGFTEADDEPAGGHPIAVVSYSWWKRRFGRDPSIVGRTVTLGSIIYTVIGVTPPEFFGTTVGESPDLWIPLSMEKQVSPGWNGLDDKWFESLKIIARLRPGITAAQAEANVDLRARQIWHDYAGPVLTKDQQQRLEQVHIPLTPAARGISSLRFEFSAPLQILMVVVGLVLLIACANIANLLLARATTRQREIAVRRAIGAGRGRLFRQMLTESLLIAVLGGALGILLASRATHALLAMVSAGPELLPLNVTPDARVLAFTFLISLVTAILFGTAPALRATRVDLTPALKEGRAAVSAGGRSGLGKALIVSQVALSLVLLIGAGLFLRSLVNLANVETGFDKQNVLLFGIDPVDAGYKIDSRLLRLYQQIEQRVSALPVVRAASISFFTFNQGAWSTGVSVQGKAPDPSSPNVNHNVVGPGYFATMGIPLLLGRVLGPEDTATSLKVAVINETMAREFFPGRSPVGGHFSIGDDPNDQDMEVVGVVKDAKYVDLQEEPQPAAYYPYTQHIGPYSRLEVRYSGDPRAIIPEVRRAVADLDRRVPVSYQKTLAQQVDQSIVSQSLVARLSVFFGLMAMFLACIGIYGLMSYAVTRRRNEIGVRMALGAGGFQVLRMVMGESLVLVGFGLIIGLPVALVAEQLVTKLLFGIKPTDPLSMVGAAAVLVSFAVAAAYLPARKAARVDPLVALRYE